MKDQKQDPIPAINLDISLEGSQKKHLPGWLSFAIPSVIVLGLLFTLTTIRSGIENAVANLADLLPVSYAFAAGMVASVNPCGVLMLPSYALYLLGTAEDKASTAKRVLKGLLLTVSITSGFAVIFALVGGIIAAGGQWLVSTFPYAGIIIGAGMVGLGVWLLVTHKTLGIEAASRVTVNPRKNLGNAFLFGIAYAAGSLSCTLPIFLVVVGSSLRGQENFAALGPFIGYVLGMGAIIVFVTLGTALFRKSMSKLLQPLTRYVHRLSAMFLIGAGLYLLYYWVFQVGLG